MVLVKKYDLDDFDTDRHIQNWINENGKKGYRIKTIEKFQRRVGSDPYKDKRMCDHLLIILEKKD